MKRKLAALLLGGLLIFGLAACSNDDTNTAADPSTETTEQAADETEAAEEADDQDDSQASSGDLGGSIIITGSTSVESILNDMKDEFEALNPNVTIEYTGSGSSAGITDTIAGNNDIGAASREVKAEEEEEGLTIEVFAYDGIAVIVNPSNGVEDISLDGLTGIYSGEITNWSELGGEDGEIFVVSREESSGTRSAFEELIGLEDAGGLTGAAAVSEGNGPVQAAVAENDNAIGYVSFSFIDDSIKALTVDGVEATAELAKSGDYPMSRPFLFVYNADTISTEAKEFIAFALSEEGQECVENKGGIRVDD